MRRLDTSRLIWICTVCKCTFFLYWSVGMKDSIYFVDCLPIFTKEKIFATFYLLLCALSPFGKGSTPKRKKVVPNGSKFFPLSFCSRSLSRRERDPSLITNRRAGFRLGLRGFSPFGNRNVMISTLWAHAQTRLHNMHSAFMLGYNFAFTRLINNCFYPKFSDKNVHKFEQVHLNTLYSLAIQNVHSKASDQTANAQADLNFPWAHRCKRLFSDVATHVALHSYFFPWGIALSSFSFNLLFANSRQNLQ